MSEIKIIKEGITKLDTDIIVNAANEYLAAGSGVCGAIFSAAGYGELTRACDAIGHCKTGGSVITPGFKLKARHIIHTVGPRWHGGNDGEAELLKGCYESALKLAVENSAKSIAFPLISAGIFGYPRDEAWDIAIKTCREFLAAHPETEIDIFFAVISDEMYSAGMAALNK